MREVLTMRVKDRYVVVPKLIGAMLIAISVVMLVYASIDAVTAWDRYKDVRACVQSVYSSDLPASEVPQALQPCLMKAEIAGIYVYNGLKPVPDEEIWNIMLPKAAWFLFWVLVLILSILVYQMGKLLIPVEEKIVAESAVKEEAPKATKKRATRKTTRKRTTRKK